MPIPYKFKLRREVIITPDSAYTQYLNTLPDNLRFTPNDEYDSYLYWQLNGKPKDFLEAYNRGMFEYNNSDLSYHAGSVAKDSNGNYLFMKPITHPTVLYETDWYNKGLVTLEDGTLRYTTPEELLELQNFKLQYKLINDSNRPNFYMYKRQYDTGGQLSKPLDWNELSMRDRAAYIRMGVANGYKNIDSIRKVYNEYRNGGYLKANVYAEGGPIDDEDLIDWIIKEEGFLKNPTNIGDGKMTLGSGLTDPKWHKLYQQRGNKWSAEDNRMAVAEEVAKRRRWAEKNIPNWNILPNSALKALLSYKYNYNFTPENSPKLFEALKNYNLYSASRLIDATSKDPKFKKGLEARRKREQEWFMKDLISLPPVDLILQAVSTKVDNPIVLQVDNTSIAPIMIPDEDTYITAHRLTEEEDTLNKLDSEIEDLVRFNNLMRMLKLENSPVYQFPLPSITTPTTSNTRSNSIKINEFEGGGSMRIAPWLTEDSEETQQKSWLEQQAEKYAQAIEDAKHPEGHYLNEVIVTPKGNLLGSVPQEAMRDNLIFTSRERKAKDRKDLSNMIKAIHKGTDTAAKVLYPLVAAPAITTITSPLMSAMARPLTTTTSLASEMFPSLTRALPYTEMADRGIMGAMGATGMYDAGKGLVEGTTPWYYAVPQAGLSGLMMTDVAPLIKEIPEVVKWDIPYFKAINSNNIEKIKELRKAHFKDKSNTSILDIEGNPLILYHGSPSKDIRIFRYTNQPKMGGRGTGTEGYYFSPNKAYADRYQVEDLMQNINKADGKTYTVFLNSKNMATFPNDVPQSWRADAFYNMNLPEREWFETNNYDAVKLGKWLNNLKGERPEIAVFNPNLIKSANSITYDDNGFIIPLSRRDNFKNNDIRYSLSSNTNKQRILNSTNNNSIENGRRKLLTWIRSPFYKERLLLEAPYKETDNILNLSSSLIEQVPIGILDRFLLSETGRVSGKTSTRPAVIKELPNGIKIYDLDTGLDVNIANDLADAAEDVTLHELLHYMTANSKGSPQSIAGEKIIYNGWMLHPEVHFDAINSINKMRSTNWQDYIMDLNNSLLPRYNDAVKIVMENPNLAKQYLLNSGKTPEEAEAGIQMLQDRYKYWYDILEQRTHLLELFISKILPHLKNPNDASEIENFLNKNPEILEGSVPYKYIKELRPGSVEDYSKYFAGALSTIPFIYKTSTNE